MTNNKKCSIKNCKYEASFQVRNMKTRKLRNTCRNHMTTTDLIISRYDNRDKELIEKKLSEKKQ